MSELLKGFAIGDRVRIHTSGKEFVGNILEISDKILSMDVEGQHTDGTVVVSCPECPRSRANILISKIAFVKRELLQEEERQMVKELHNASGQSATDAGLVMTGQGPSLREKLQGLLTEFTKLEKDNGLVEQQRFSTEFPETETGRRLGIQKPELEKLVEGLIRDGILYSPRKDFLKRTGA